jgi:hypothetical protein
MQAVDCDGGGGCMMQADMGGVWVYMFAAAKWSYDWLFVYSLVIGLLALGVGGVVYLHRERRNRNN